MTYPEGKFPAEISIADKLEADVQELASAAKILAEHWRSQEKANPSLAPDLLSTPLQPQQDAPSSIEEARRLLSWKATAIGKFVQQPTDFLRTLAINIQYTACLRWLLEYQVLACIPTAGNVSIKDVAHLAAVPESDLLSITRMMSTAGFLREPQPGHVAHTPISAQFVGSKTVRDASTFLTERVVPAALQMGSQPQRSLASQKSFDHSFPYHQGLHHDRQAFLQACKRDPRLNRQWSAYVKHVGDEQWDGSDAVSDVLTRLDWSNLGNACVVETCALSPILSTSLAELHPRLQCIVQLHEAAHRDHHKDRQSSISDPNLGDQNFIFESEYNTDRIAVQTRVSGTAQVIRDAAVYILHIPSAYSRVAAETQSLSEWVLTELRSHFDVLRDNSRSTLIISAPAMLPEPGSVDLETEIAARLRSLSAYQLINEREMELRDLIGLIDGIKDDVGGLAVINRLQSRRNVTAALCVKYQRSTGTRQASTVRQKTTHA
jgi:hypothetical protein